MMLSAGGLGCSIEWRTPEFGRPNDQRVLKHASPLQVSK